MQCTHSESQFKGTWFEESRIPVQKVVRFVCYWTLLPPPRHSLLINEFGFSDHTIVDWSNFLREVCFDYLSKNDQPIGGPNSIIEIDEAKIGHRKYNRGRILDGAWIFGGIDRETKEVFIVPVANRGRDTLLPIIKKWVKPGSTIMSDCWKAYDCLENEDYKHLKVNHTYNFVDPDTGAHTQHIERTWREVRSNVPRFGNLNHHLHTHLAEFLFKRKFSDYKSRIHYVWRAIAQFMSTDKVEGDD